MAVDAKICGLTRPEDAAFAVQHGAWRLGVIFASGPRVVTRGQAAEIVAVSGGVPVLGVFGPGPLRTMLGTVRAAGLSGVQLYGDHPDDVARQLRDEGLEVWRIVPVAAGMDLVGAMGRGAADSDAVLLEAHVPGGSGGMGIPVALELARTARAAARQHTVVLAGGLTADTVSDAIRVVEPDAVDVSSGIESSPGIKDHQLIARFLENVRVARLAD